MDRRPLTKHVFFTVLPVSIPCFRQPVPFTFFLRRSEWKILLSRALLLLVIPVPYHG